MLKKLIVINQIEIIIFVCICLSRLIVADFSNSFHSVDVGNYILAVYDYDISVDRPHLPGYFLYIYFFKFLTLFFENSNALFVVFQGIFQALSSVFIYKIIKDKFELKYKLLIIATIFSIPMVYLYGIMSEIYSVELLAISVFLYLLHKDKVSLILPFMAIIFGIRQSSGIFLLPAVFYLYYYEFKYNNYKIKNLLISVVIFTIICLLWFIPLTQSTGGISNYFNLLDLQNSYVSELKFLNNLISFLTYSVFYLIPISIVYSLSKRNEDFKLNKTNFLYLLIIIPQLLFYVFYHYNKGYALLFIPVLVLYIIFNYQVKAKVLIIVTVFNLLVFYLLPGNIPSFNTQVKREYRNISVSKVWFERFQYWWLPSLSSHNVSVVLHNDIEANKVKIYNLVKDNPLLIDNSLVARGRNVSYILPKVLILERTYNTLESYDRHFNYIDFSRRNDLSLVMKKGFVIIDKEYYKNYFTKIADIKLETNYYYIIANKENKLDEFLKLNNDHFGYD